MKKYILLLTIAIILLITTSCSTSYHVNLYLIESYQSYFEPITSLQLTKQANEKLTVEDYRNLTKDYITFLYSEKEFLENEHLGKPLKAFSSNLLLEEIDPYIEITKDIDIYVYCNTKIIKLGSDYGFNGCIYYTYDKSLYDYSIPDNINLVKNKSLNAQRLVRSFSSEYITFDDLYYFVVNCVNTVGYNNYLKEQKYNYSEKDNVTFKVNDEVISFPYKLPKENIIFFAEYKNS